MVANNLEKNSEFYRDYLAQPMASYDSYNADTEAPTEQDAYIDTIADPEQQAELHSANYLTDYEMEHGVIMWQYKV